MGSFGEVHKDTAIADISEIADHETRVVALEESGGGSLSWTPKWIQWQMGATGWNDKDLSGDGVPANALCFIMVENAAAGSELEGGVRENGSSDAKYFDLHEAEQGGRTPMLMVVKADASSIIECYAQDESNIYFSLIGYLV